MTTNNKSSLEFKSEVIAYLDKTAKAVWAQAEQEAKLGRYHTAEPLKQRAGAYENAAAYIRQMETHTT